MIGFIVLFLFLGLVLIGAPIGTSMGIAGLVCLVLDGTSLSVVPYNYYSSLTSFVLLAIPYFILGGAIMERAGISSRLIRFAQSMVISYCSLRAASLTETAASISLRPSSIRFA